MWIYFFLLLFNGIITVQNTERMLLFLPSLLLQVWMVSCSASVGLSSVRLTSPCGSWPMWEHRVTSFLSILLETCFSTKASTSLSSPSSPWLVWVYPWRWSSSVSSLTDWARLRRLIQHSTVSGFSRLIPRLKKTCSHSSIEPIKCARKVNEVAPVCIVYRMVCKSSEFAEHFSLLKGVLRGTSLKVQCLAQEHISMQPRWDYKPCLTLTFFFL